MRTNRAFRLRRAIWRVRRSVPRVARPLSRVLPQFEPPTKPILVVGCPRSGTSTLLQGLLRSAELRSVQSEGHILWDEFHHPRDRAWDSDALTAADVTHREREYVYCAIRLFARRRRFVDKTPESCLRLSYLDELFPQATFVFLHRRAADNVNSLVEAWKARPRFVKYRLPEPLTGLGVLNGHQWSFVLVPGWRELADASLEAICARQYVACNEAVLRARSSMDSSRWIDIAYEDLVQTPTDVLRSLYDQLGLRVTSHAERFAANLAERPGRTALSAPGIGKWREQNPEAIAGIQPLVAETERRLGYTPLP
jgi:LPS sulfotransferase NodH